MRLGVFIHLDTAESFLLIKDDIGRFFDTKPYASFVERNADGFYEHKVRLTGKIPETITDLAYEAIEALRSALDQAIYPVATLCKARRPDLIHFPIGNDASDFENILNGKYMKDMPSDILTLFRKFKPYKGGNNTIWSLNQIRRQSTHRLQVSVGTSSGGIHIRSMIASGPIQLPASTWNREKNEIVFATTSHEAKLQYDVDLSFFVAFGQVEGVSGQPVIETLEVMVKEIDSIVYELEKECWVIGLVE